MSTSWTNYGGVADSSKIIRNEIKKKLGFTSRQVSVRSQSYSMGSSIRVEIKAKEAIPFMTEIKAIAKGEESVSRCEVTGDILSGGNTYVDVCIDYELELELHRSIMPEIRDGIDRALVEPDCQSVEVFIGTTRFNFKRNDGEVWFDVFGSGFSHRFYNDPQLSAAIARMVSNFLMKEKLPHPFLAAPTPPAASKEIATSLLTSAAVECFSHSKTGADLWTVQLPERLDREGFKDKLDEAKAIGGNYTRAYRQAGFPGGFTFPTKELAEQFLAANSSGVESNSSGEGSDEAIKPTKPALANNPEKLRSLADNLIKQAEGKLADRLENTPKRQRQASFARIEGAKMMMAARIIEACIDNPDAPKITKALALEAAAKRVSHGGGYYSCGFETNEFSYTTPTHETLRALVGEADKQEQERLKKEQAKSRELSEIRFLTIDGFFPTPKPIINKMIEAVGGVEGKSVIDPSCGIGSILEAAINEGASIVKGIEVNHRLAEFCKLHICEDVDHADFLESGGFADERFDLVLMNPPFEKKAAPIHVIKAFGLLKNNGTLCTVLPTMIQSGDQYQSFRVWLDNSPSHYHWIDLPDGAFNSKTEAFRQTATSTCLLVIES